MNAEISFDLDSPQSDQVVDQLKKIQGLMGATAESLEAAPHTLREVLTVLPPSEIEQLIRDSGMKTPIPFFNPS